MTIQYKIRQYLKELTLIEQLEVLKDLSMSIRKENGLRIEQERIKCRYKYPKIKEESNAYKI